MFILIRLNTKEFHRMSEFLDTIEAKIATIMSSSGAHAPDDTTKAVVEAISTHVDTLQGQLDAATARIAELEKIDTDLVEKLQPEPEATAEPTPPVAEPAPVAA